MHGTECAIIKVVQPNKRKSDWLDMMADRFSQAVQFGLDAARSERTSSRVRLHRVIYRLARIRFGLPADYTRMVVNAVVSLARSYYRLRRAKRRASFPRVNGSQGIGLGVGSYAIIHNGNRFVLRISTGVRGQYIWLPLCVPSRYRKYMALARGDAKLFKRGGEWYVMLPVRIPQTPAGCSGESTFIGVDLGVVRHATVVTPDRTVFFDGREARHRREHFADLRRRYQRHRRTDLVKNQKGKESRWMADLNHKISHQIVGLAAQYPSPVIVLERLDGIRHRIHGSKRFNRMIASWAFRDLVDKIKYKAARLGITVVFVDPRKTSQSCSQCGHATRSNRPDQATFRCVACGYSTNADRNAARNIAAAGARLLLQGLPDTARPEVGQTESVGIRPDGVKGCASAHSDPNLTSSVLEPHWL